MPGSSSSIAGCNIVLNTVIADELKEFADILENSNDFSSALHELIQKTIKNIKELFLMEMDMIKHGLKKLKNVVY